MKLVKCITNKRSGAEDYLVVGQIYEVEKDLGTLWILKGQKFEWSKIRFIDLDQKEIVPAPIKALSLECPCGLIRSTCEYHQQ